MAKRSSKGDPKTTTQQRKISVALNGYGVIGKRVADAVASQDDMELAGIAAIATDCWNLFRAGVEYSHARRKHWDQYCFRSQTLEQTRRQES